MGIGEYCLFDYLMGESGFFAQVLLCNAAGLRIEASASRAGVTGVCHLMQPTISTVPEYCEH